MRVSNGLRIVLLALLLVLVLSTVDAREYQINVTDDTGITVSMKRRPLRLVSLAPNMTEILYALGAGDRLVGVTEYCDYPRAASKIAKIGGVQIQSEKVLMLKADLVVAHAGMQKQIVNHLRRLKVPVIALDPDDWDSLLVTIKKIGVVTGTSPQAVKLVNEMEGRKRRVEAKRKTRNVRVFVEVWNKPLMTAGPGTFLHELINLAGGSDIAADATVPWTLFPEEKVLQRDPEVIILTCNNREEVLKRRAWRRITAVRNGRVYEVNPDIYCRPGPRLVEALEDLSSLLERAGGESH